MFISNLITFSFRQTDVEYIKSRIIYPTSSPPVHKVGKNIPGNSLTLSLLGYQKTRKRGGGVILPPPPLSPMFDVQILQMIHTSLESSCALLLKSAKKNCKFAKIDFFLAKSSYIVKIFAKKNCPKNDKIFIFVKPSTMLFQICKKFCKILNNLMFN